LVWYLWLIIAVAFLFALYLYLIAPSLRHPALGVLGGKYYAHRGLHDGNHAVPENSLAAFQLAVEAGYGMELDVQLTKDHVLIVHHDGNTRRVCGVDREICNTLYEELPPLPDGSPIPTFSDVMALVAGQEPMIVEVKPDGDPLANAVAAREALSTYPGPYCVESFHPLVVRYFRKNAPDVLRGQLAMGGPYHAGETNRVQFTVLKYMLLNFLGRPHFIAYSCALDRNLSMGLMKRLFHPILVAWTVRDQKTMDYAQAQYDLPIFELFTPKPKQ